MGKILERIFELDSKFSELSKLTEGYNTYVLTVAMLEEVYDAFKQLMPFATRCYTVANLDESYKLIVGHQLWKERYRRIPIDEYRKDVFFTVIREYGDIIAPYVRESIKNEFTTLVSLTKNLIPYPEETYYITVNREIILIDDEDIRNRERIFVEELVITTSDPSRLTLRYTQPHSSPRYIYIYNLKYVYLLEDIIDVVLETCHKISEKLKSIKEHNDKIMEEIRKVVLPYKLSKELGR